MLAENGAVGVVFNGEIYNYLELRDDLAKRGEAFHTTSDTEVLLRMVSRDGPAALDGLRGMFAFVAWNDERGELLLARDRVGKKPLYYRVEDDILYFASALQALRSVSRSPWEVDPVALDKYFTFGYVPAPETIFTGVRKLPAGSFAVQGQHGVQVARFWDLSGKAQAYERS
jgi:asparagine synthase (glutamine-hydrolysing)